MTWYEAKEKYPPHYFPWPGRKFGEKSSSSRLTDLQMMIREQYAPTVESYIERWQENERAISGPDNGAAEASR
jgi:hypothetical protein